MAADTGNVSGLNLKKPENALPLQSDGKWPPKEK